jgi:uncharacterized protein YceK
MNKYLAFGFSSLLTLSGCATIISGDTDKVAFTSTPENATFNIKDEKGQSVHQGTTPASVVLERGNGYFDGQTYQVDFSSPGYSPKTLPLDSSMNGWYIGNLIFGGIIGLLIVDPATGAMWDLPEKMETSLTKE